MQIRDADATLIVAQLLFLEAEATSRPIHLYINSPGGSVTAGLSIYDTYAHSFSSNPTYHRIGQNAIHFIASAHVLHGPSMLDGVSTPRGRYVLRHVPSRFTTVIGERGYRQCLPNASVMIHRKSLFDG